MSEQRSTQHTSSRRGATTIQRAYLATLARHLHARRLFAASGPSDLNHAIITRIAQLQRRC